MAVKFFTLQSTPKDVLYFLGGENVIDKINLVENVKSEFPQKPKKDGYTNGEIFKMYFDRSMGEARRAKNVTDVRF